MVFPTHKFNVIRPIETAYKGYRFRSRLEARWAVFFDACGVKWEYEPEGFQEGDLYYLPDFLLHGAKGRGGDELYVEVKGYSENGHLKLEDLQKAETFGKHWRQGAEYNEEGYGIPLLIVDNIFHLASGEELEQHYIQLGTEGEFYHFGWIDGDHCWPTYVGLNKTGDFIVDDCNDSWYDDYDNNATEWALHQAKQARFEHGEQPHIISWKQYRKECEKQQEEEEKQEAHRQEILRKLKERKRAVVIRKLKFKKKY